MSSGKIEQNYFNNIESNLFFNELDFFSEDYIHKSHYFESKLIKEEIHNKSNITFTHLKTKFIDHNLNIIQKIHFILENSHELSSKQKYDYCSHQRFFMKLYLKKIINRV